MNKNELLAKIKATNKVIHLKSLDSDVTLKQLPANEVLRLNSEFAEDKITKEEMTFALISLSIVDDNGKQMFTVDEIKENLNIEVMTELAEAVAEINGMNVEKVNTELKKAQLEGSATS